jgi:hypothetical protein
MRLMDNAVVTTFAGGVAKLVNLPVLIAAPVPKDLDRFGGFVRHVVIFNPADDVQTGDTFLIVSWGPFPVTNKVYHVYSASPEGGMGLEVIRALVGEKEMR